MNKIEFGDCRETMRRWAAQGIKAQMCVTSPPYFGLRDYGHDGQLGLEQTPEEYIANMVEVFRCVRDVLAEDGTLWLNIGDSYARAGGWSNNAGLDGKMRHESNRAVTNISASGRASQKLPPGLKSKDLIGIPWMLAFALRADGWYLRQEIIWHKPNPIPERIEVGRCAKSHEHVFLLAKSERPYFDGAAIADTSQEGTPKAKQSVWSISVRPYKGAHFATFPPALIEPCILAGSRPGGIVLDPFMGSGTTAAVALQHGRQYLGCELNPEYEPLQTARIASIQ